MNKQANFILLGNIDIIWFKMKIISYNVNGIRAAVTKGFLDWLQQANPDVICLQEIKATEDQIPKLEIEMAGYPYQYYFPAQKKGYSGVAILSKTKPDTVVYGTGIEYMDSEGRNLRADFGDISVMSLYLPSGTNIDRLDHKFQYMDDFQLYINQLKKEIPNLVICGDYNICHEAIDIHDPIRNAKVSGFLPEERAWLQQLKDWGLIDTFRALHPDTGAQYSWFDYRSKGFDDNRGLRIDVVMATAPLAQRCTESSIDYELRGIERPSDHAPVWSVFSEE